LDKIEKHKILGAIIYPALFVAIIALVHFIQFVFEFNFTTYGIYPRKLKGIMGVLFSPFIHGDYKHLFNNSIPILILGSLLFYSYKKVALKVVIWIVIMGGFWTWVSARGSYHIGASGLVYGLFSFLIFSGFIRRNLQLISLSLFVVMVYGGLVWGIFPIDLKISFEGHLWGFISGIILAFYYKKEGLQHVEYVWNDDDLDESNPYWEINESNIEEKSQPRIKYFFRAKK